MAKAKDVERQVSQMTREIKELLQDIKDSLSAKDSESFLDDGNDLIIQTLQKAHQVCVNGLKTCEPAIKGAANQRNVVRGAEEMKRKAQEQRDQQRKKFSSGASWLRFATQKSFDWETRGIYYGFAYYTGRKKDEGKKAVWHEGVYHIFDTMDEAEKFMLEKKKERDAAEKSKRRFSEAEEDARKTMSSLKGDKVDSFTKRRMAMMSDESTESIGGSYKEITEGQAVENIKMAKSNEPPLKYGSDAIHVSIEDNEYQAKVWRYPDYVYETSVKSNKEQAIADAKKWINANPADTWGRNPKNPKVK